MAAASIFVACKAVPLEDPDSQNVHIKFYNWAGCQDSDYTSDAQFNNLPLTANVDNAVPSGILSFMPVNTNGKINVYGRQENNGTEDLIPDGHCLNGYDLYYRVTPTLGSFKRAITLSFGSICLGSLIVSIIRVIRSLVNSGQNSSSSFVRCFFDCILSCIESILTYFNTYAFAEMAIYGKSYMDSGHDAWELMKARGIDMIVNDNLVGGVALFGSLLSGLMCAGFAALLSRFVLIEESWALWALIAFFVGLTMAMCAMEVILSGTVTIFVCLAEDPAALTDNHRSHESVFLALRDRFPHAVLSAPGNF